MSELISRQKLIEEAERLRTAYNFSACAVIGKENCEGSCADCILDSLEEFINSQPPADQWIPCSEKLPDEEGSYLCTYGKYHMGVYRFSNDLYSVDDYDFTEYKGRAGFYAYDSEWGYGEVDYITAWMPLPEPYKGVE